MGELSSEAEAFKELDLPNLPEEVYDKDFVQLRHVESEVDDHGLLY